MSEHSISAVGREPAGKGASRRLRRAGQIPAIIYGGHAEPQSVQLDHEKVWIASQNEWFYSSILSLDVDGKVEKVLLRDMQRHPFRQLVMHLDFLRVSENEAVRVNVPLHFLNQETSPAGKASGVVVTHNLNEVQISCLPRDLPEFIEVDLADLEPGDLVHLSEIKLPSGVEIPELKLGKEHDVAVVTAGYVQADPEPGEEGDAEGDAQA